MLDSSCERESEILRSLDYVMLQSYFVFKCMIVEVIGGEGVCGSKYIRAVWRCNGFFFKFWYNRIRMFMNVSLMRSVCVCVRGWGGERILLTKLVFSKLQWNFGFMYLSRGCRGVIFNTCIMCCTSFGRGRGMCAGVPIKQDSVFLGLFWNLFSFSSSF